MKKITILGSTGSIGTQALEIIRANPEKYDVSMLSANSQIDLLVRQINEFGPDVAVVVDETAGKKLQKMYTGPTKIRVGEDALTEYTGSTTSDIVLTALSGAAGIRPTLAAIEAGKTIALANKETLVAAGELVLRKVAENKVNLLPVDSEHSAIFQCLEGNRQAGFKKLILTASGGPFRGYTKKELETVSVQECLRHPTWNMGKKITIDSATMFNKGLEIIEAHYLFNADYKHIEVVIHPQSIVHSMVEFKDGAILAQLGLPDMRLPIQLAFSYPERYYIENNYINWEKLTQLTFELPDKEVFRSLSLAYYAGKIGKSAPLALNASNEVAVAAFLQEKISFLQIFDIVEYIIGMHVPEKIRDFIDIKDLDEDVRRQTEEAIRRLKIREGHG